MLYAHLKGLRTACVFVPLLGLAACGGGRSGEDIAGGIDVTTTVSGRVFDISGVTRVPVAGATVALRDSTGASLSSTTSASDGSYSLKVFTSKKVYIATSKPSYVNTNSRIFAPSAVDTLDIILLTPAGAKQVA